MKKNLLFIVIPVILILVLLVSGCTPAKKTTTTEVTLPQVSESVNSLRSEVVSLKNTVTPMTATINQLSNDVTTLKQSGGGATTVQVADLNNKVVDLTNKINNLSTSGADTAEITKLKADMVVVKDLITQINMDLEELAARIDKLENPSSSSSSKSGVDPEDVIELELRYFPNNTIKTGGNSLSMPVRLKVTNTLTRDIDEVVLGIEARVSVDDMDIDSMILSGSGITWIGNGSGSYWAFENWNDIPLKALESKSYNFTLKITFENVAADDNEAFISLDIYADDYEYK